MGKESTSKKGGKVAFGAGVALAAAAAGYFLYGTKEGARRRKEIRGWMLKARGEVLEKIEQMREIDKSSYEGVVDKIVSKYAKVRGADKKEVEKVRRELKGYWRHIEKHLKEKKGRGGRGKTRRQKKA